MKQRIIITVVALLAFSSAFGQNFEKVVFNNKEAGEYFLRACGVIFESGTTLHQY